MSEEEEKKQPQGYTTHEISHRVDLAGLSEEELKTHIRELYDVIEELQVAKSAFIDSTYDGYWDWLLQEDYEYMSPRFWEIFGFDYRTKIHSPSEWQDLIFKEDLKVALENLKEHISSKGEHPYSQEVRYRHADGSTVTVLCRGKVVEWSESGDAVRMIGTHTDVTALKKAQEFARAASEAKTELLARVAHELRTPLNTLSLLSQRLAVSTKVLPEDVLEDISIMYRTCAELSSLVNDLIDSSQVEEGVPSLSIDLININELVQGVCDSFASSFTTKGISLDSQLQNGEPYLKTDGMRVRQILRNLLSNALKYTEPGGTVTISAKVEEKNSVCTAVFSIIDTGTGMSPEMTSKLFSKYEKGHHDRVGSTGLGLMIVKQLSTLLGGRVSVTSAPQRGTTFSVTIPEFCESEQVSSINALISMEPLIPGTKNALSLREREITKGMTILLIHQDVRIIMHLRQLLLSLGVLPLQAFSIEEAMCEYAERGKISVLFVHPETTDASVLNLDKYLDNLSRFNAPVVFFGLTSPLFGKRKGFSYVDDHILFEQLMRLAISLVLEWKEKET